LWPTHEPRRWRRLEAAARFIIQHQAVASLQVAARCLVAAEDQLASCFWSAGHRRLDGTEADRAHTCLQEVEHREAWAETILDRSLLVGALEAGSCLASFLDSDLGSSRNADRARRRAAAAGLGAVLAFRFVSQELCPLPRGT